MSGITMRGRSPAKTLGNRRLRLLKLHVQAEEQATAFNLHLRSLRDSLHMEPLAGPRTLADGPGPTQLPKGVTRASAGCGMTCVPQSVRLAPGASGSAGRVLGSQEQCHHQQSAQTPTL